MKYKIVLVPFPFDDLSNVKVRPAICLTNEMTGYNHVVIAFITSQFNTATEPTDLLLHEKEPDFNRMGLKQSSAIRLHRLITVPSRIIQRQLGILPADYHLELEEKLIELFEL